LYRDNAAASVTILIIAPPLLPFRGVIVAQHLDFGDCVETGGHAEQIAAARWH
jgi:hypothetical protein